MWQKIKKHIDLKILPKTLGAKVMLFANFDHNSEVKLWIGLWVVSLGISVPYKFRTKSLDEDGFVSWGAEITEDYSLYLRWGSEYRFIELPGSLEFYRRSILLKDGTWYHEMYDTNVVSWQDIDKNTWKESFPVTYVLKNQTVQETIADVSVREMEYRRKWLRVLPWFRKVSSVIDVTFHNEIGKRVGTWKGGVTGCSHDMLPGEDPHQCLLRMMSERDF